MENQNNETKQKRRSGHEQATSWTYTYTLGYLINDNSLGQPVCEWCGAALLTVHHIIVECQGLQRERHDIGSKVETLEHERSSLGRANTHVVFEFLRMTTFLS